MVAARIAALLCASTVLVAQACTNGTPQWDEATGHISGTVSEEKVRRSHNVKGNVR